MQKRELMYSTSDSYGVIEVYQDTLLRSLHFGTPARQSAMYPGQPHILPLSYSRYMLAPLLFIENPKQILILGLGAGSLFHCLHHYSQAHIDTVELRQAVVDVARQFFMLPEPDERFHSHVMSAMDYMQQTTRLYDITLIDIYSDQGIDLSLLEQSFYLHLQHCMTDTGIACFNLWSSHPKRYQQILQLIRQTFAYSHELEVPRKGNVIVIAARFDFLQHPLHLQQHAIELETKLNIEFTSILEAITYKT